MRNQILNLFTEQTEWEELEALATNLEEVAIGLRLTAPASDRVPFPVTKRKRPIHLAEVPDVTL